MKKRKRMLALLLAVSMCVSGVSTVKAGMPEETLSEEIMSEVVLPEEAVTEGIMSEVTLPEETVTEGTLSEEILLEETVPEETERTCFSEGDFPVTGSCSRSP